MTSHTFSTNEQEAEYKRLCHIQDSFDEKSKKHLLKAGLKSGMDCLEVGLGAGSLASWMKVEVGDKGSVLGVDLNIDFIDDDIKFDLLQGDVLELDIKASFDLIHLRYVLIHNRNSKDIIKKLYGLLRSDGKLVVEEPDFTLAKWIDAKDLDGCKRVNGAICKTFEKKGLKAHYGSTAHLSLEESGFKIDENRPYFHLCSGGEDVAKVMASSARALSKDYLETGICSKEDIEAYIQACEDPESLGVYYATIALTAVKKYDSNKEKTLEVVQRRDDGIYLAETESEISNCFELMSELRPHLSKEDFFQKVHEQMNAGYHLFTMYKDSVLVAVCGCRIASNLAWGKHLYIDDLVSLSDQRSLGHGHEVLEYLMGFAKEKGCVQVHLDSGVQRFAAHRFYLREGFKIASHHLSQEV